MPKGPKGQKRPVDVIGNAVKVMQIATGEAEEDIDDDGKDKAAQELGRKGGQARAKKLSKKRLPVQAALLKHGIGAPLSRARVLMMMW
jgi:hypothetical protein